MSRALVAPVVLALLVAAPLMTASALGGALAFANFAVPANLPRAHSSGEPSLGVNLATDAAMFQAYDATLKLTFDAAGNPTWSDVSPLLPSPPNFDPILFTDQRTGWTFGGGLGQPGCTWLQMTNDDGADWVPMSPACPLPSDDHPSVGGGPFHAPLPDTSALGLDAVYVCEQAGTNRCVASLDGGLTFGLPVAAAGDCHSFHGHVKVSADGTAYVPNGYCGNLQGGFLSVDNGQSWNAYHIPGTRSEPRGGGFDPSIATTPDNTIYEAWADGINYHPFVARSTDHGATWDRLTDLTPTLGAGTNVDSTFQAMVAGDNGRVAVAYLATTDGNGANPYAGNFAGSWHLYISFSYDGGLTWQTVKATTDPVQRGCIFDVINSPSCHRNLLDFMDASVAQDGRVLVAYADGCTSATCIGPSGTSGSSTDALGVVARQVGGPGMYAP